MLRCIPAAPYFHSTVKAILCQSVKPGLRQKIYQKFSSGTLFIPLKRIIVPYSIIYVQAAWADKKYFHWHFLLFVVLHPMLE